MRAGNRMGEAQTSGVEENAIEAAGPSPHRFRGPGRRSGSVEMVSQDRVPDMRHVDTDLMGPAGLQRQLEMRRPHPCRLAHTIVGHRPLSPRHHGHPLAVPRMASDGRIHGTLHAAGETPYDRLVDALDAVDGELSGKSDMGAVVLGDHQNPADLPIEAMNDARPGDTADPRQAVTAMGEQGVDQGAGRMTGRRMHHHAGGLDDDHQMFVLEQDLERQRLRHRGRRLGRRQMEVETLPAFDPTGRVGYRPLALSETAFPDQPLQALARQIRDAGGKKPVEAAALEGGVDLDGEAARLARHGGEVEGWLRFVKIFVVVGGVVLFFGTGLLIYLLMHRSLTPQPPATASWEVTLPEGGRLVRAQLDGGDLLLWIEKDAGETELLLVDRGTGVTKGRLRLVPPR